jgi:hypothetical protein
MTSSTQPVAASTLVLLFADQFVPACEGKLSALKAPYTTPASGKKVLSVELADAICVATLFSMQEQGLIQLELQTGKLLWLLPTKSACAISLKDESRSGLQGLVLTALRKGGKIAVSKIVDVLFDGDYSMPHRRIIQLAQIEAIEGGYLTVPEDNRSIVKKILSSDLQVAPNMEKLQTFAYQASEFASRLKYWQAQNAELYSEVLKGVKSSISGHTESND